MKLSTIFFLLPFALAAACSSEKQAALDARAAVAKHGGQNLGSDSGNLSGTLAVSLAHGSDGSAVDETSPLVLSDASGVVLHVQWSVSGITAGQYAYLAATLCDPYAGLTNTNGGAWVGSPCVNGYQAAQAHSLFAFPGVQADSSGGISENLQFTVATAAVFPQGSEWTIPLTLYVGGASPNPSTDTAVPMAGGVSSVTIPLTAVHAASTTILLLSGTSAPAGSITLQNGQANPVAGEVYTFSYTPMSTQLGATYTGEYLPSTTTVQLLPPSINNGLTAQLVQGSTQLSDSEQFTRHYAAGAAADQTNSGRSALTLSPDPAALAIPTFSVNNFAGYGDYSDLSVTASWFVPTPTLAGTTLTMQSSIAWNGNDYTDAYLEVYPSYVRSLDISPIAQTDLGITSAFTCNGGEMSGSLGWAAGPNTQKACNTYNLGQVFNLRALRSGQPATFLNPVYVIQLPADGQIANTSLGLDGATTLSTSDDPGCDADNSSGSAGVVWTDASTTPSRTDWSAVRCLAYSYAGLVSSPFLISPFTTVLSPSVVAGAAAGATDLTTFTFSVTADNVTPAGGSAWASEPTHQTATLWADTTFLEAGNGVGGKVGVLTPLQTPESVFASGLPLPDLTVQWTLGGGATFDTSASPETWFTTVPLDTQGNPAVLSCQPIQPQQLTCTLQSANAGVDIAAPGGPGPQGYGRNELFGYLHYSFNPGQAYDGELAPHTATVSSSASWLMNGDLPGSLSGPVEYDTVIGPNQITLTKAVHGGATTAPAGTMVAYDISFGAEGLNSGALGAGGVAVYDFFGKDYTPGTNGSTGTLTAQAPGCISPKPVSMQFGGAVGGTASPAPPAFYYTTAVAPDMGTSTSWQPVPAGGAIAANATAVKIVPTSSLGSSGVLLPVDGVETVQVVLQSATTDSGQLCNSAAISATLFNPTATAEASVTLTAPLPPDHDGDGVPDAFDPAPCDPGISALSFYPAQDRYSMVLFEDLWPQIGDHDYNDQNAAVNYAFVLDANGNTVGLEATFTMLSIGATIENGFYLHLPVASNAISSASITLGDGLPAPVAPLASFAGGIPTDAIFVIAADTRSVYGGETGMINTVPSLGISTGTAVTLDLRFTAPLANSSDGLPLDAAPFDLFIARVGDPTHQVHLSSWDGSATFGAGLNTGDDQSGSGNNSGRYYVAANGLPWGIDVPALVDWPTERTPINALYPGIAGFAATAGQTDASYYASPVASAAWQDNVSGSPQTVAPPLAFDASIFPTIGSTSCY